MSIHAGTIYPLNQGVDLYNPPIASKELAFVQLLNIEPRLGRLFTSRGYGVFQDIASIDTIVGFGYYTLPNFNFANLYMFTSTSIYRYDFENEQFFDTPIYTSFPASLDRYVTFQWYDALYVTKPNAKYVKIQQAIVTEIAGAPFGRYGIVANSHVYMGNVGGISSRTFTRLQWSDLDAPELWELTPATSEADFYDLEPTNAYITGVSYQRGQPLVYSPTAITVGTPIGLPGGFRHDPLFPGLGSIFHYSVVQNKEIDYFIGPDNIYALNGFQPIEIGSPIWEWFIADVKIVDDTCVYGYVDSRKKQVFWVYTANDNAIRSIVFNYLENKWSVRDAQDLTAWFDSPRITFRGFQTIDEIDTIIDTDASIIDDPDAGFPVIVPQLTGLNTGSGILVGQVSNELLDAENTPIIAEAETFDLYYEYPDLTKELNKASIEFTGLGRPDIQLEIGIRANQLEDIEWCTPIDVLQLNGTFSFFFRVQGVGKFIRFRLSWTNTETDYIDDIRLLSVIKVEDELRATQK